MQSTTALADLSFYLISRYFLSIRGVIFSFHNHRNSQTSYQRGRNRDKQQRQQQIVLIC